MNQECMFLTALYASIYSPMLPYHYSTEHNLPVLESLLSGGHTAPGVTQGHLHARRYRCEISMHKTFKIEPDRTKTMTSY